MSDCSDEYEEEDDNFSDGSFHFEDEEDAVPAWAAPKPKGNEDEEGGKSSIGGAGIANDSINTAGSPSTGTPGASSSGGNSGGASSSSAHSSKSGAGGNGIGNGILSKKPPRSHPLVSTIFVDEGMCDNGNGISSDSTGGDDPYYQQEGLSKTSKERAYKIPFKTLSFEIAEDRANHSSPNGGNNANGRGNNANGIGNGNSSSSSSNAQGFGNDSVGNNNNGNNGVNGTVGNGKSGKLRSVEDEIDRSARQVMELTALSKDEALLVLQQERWSVSDATEKWFADSEKVRRVMLSITSE
jgi:hypothetical protein